MSDRKKLIEVALPLEAINRESAREKAIRHGHPSTLHLWWARRPLAACRAVLFASLVDDPGNDLPEPEAGRERQRLFALIEQLVNWDNVKDERVLAEAQEAIARSTAGSAPPVLDPFCGGGSIPLEAQRLGLTAHASDLNPVAVLITKALVEIPPRFAGRTPVNPGDRLALAQGTWRGAAGLAADLRYYGRWIREEAERRIGDLYPKGPNGETVIAWLWARTVRCPNPACGAEMPLVRSFTLSTRPTARAWVEPLVDHEAKVVRFEPRTGVGTVPEPTVGRRGARCLVCGASVPLDVIRQAGRKQRLGQRLMCVVVEGGNGRLYLPATEEHVRAAEQARPAWEPDTDLPKQALGFRVQLYGMTGHRDLFTRRQLSALGTFSDLVAEARQHARRDALAAGLPDDGISLEQGGAGAARYAEAVTTYLGLALSRAVDYHSALCTWGSDPKNLLVRHTFTRQALSMVWDFAENNPFSTSAGNWLDSTEWVAKVLDGLPAGPQGYCRQADAAQAIDHVPGIVIVTDPPYFDNVPYADLSDFFYVWLRRSLGGVFPSLFRTVLTPKTEELVADPFRHGTREAGETHFLRGMQRAFEQIRRAGNADYPVAIFYAFKQAETERGGEDGQPGHEARTASTGWELMLQGLIDAGFQVTGTWPVRTELGNRTRNINSNALASSIVLIGRPRAVDAPEATRRELTAALRADLPEALRQLTQGAIAPVDLAQAAIGPGMAVFSRYRHVLEANGSPMRVRTALQLINAEMDAFLSEQEGELDPGSRFCVAWFEQYASLEGPYGEADVLARAKNTSVERLAEAGVLSARSGKVRLLRRDEYPENPDATDGRYTAWAGVQQLIRALDRTGEAGAGELMRVLGGSRAEDARRLAYRLYTLSERRGWSEEALAYNGLVASWSAAQRHADEPPATQGRIL